MFQQKLLSLRQRKKAEPPSREELGHPALCDRSEKRKKMVHVLLKPGLENFEHYFTACEVSAIVQ